MISYLKKLNFYAVSGLALFVWMAFLDSNDFISQIQMQRTIGKLNDEKAYYTQQLKQSEIEQKLVLGSTTQTEKFAREKYLMSKKNETIYIITNERNELIP